MFSKILTFRKNSEGCKQLQEISAATRATLAKLTFVAALKRMQNYLFVKWTLTVPSTTLECPTRLESTRESRRSAKIQTKKTLRINKYTNEKVAIKIVDRKIITDLNIFLYLENELRLRSRFNHPNIVKVYDIIYENDIILVVMEYIPNGDLHTVVAKGITFTTDEQIKIAYGLLSALAYLHERGISHRDLKSENVLFDEHYTPKLCDFGLFKENSSNMCTYCGTPLYMAPEIITSPKYDGMKVDIWAFGVTLHILAVSAFTWSLMPGCQYIKLIQDGNLTITVVASGIIGKLVENALNFNPEGRPSAVDLLNYLDYSNNHPKIASG